MLVPTKRAALATGLSEWELRRGYKEGIYPAILIGRGERARRLRWDIELLNNEIHRRMQEGANEN